ncbi:glycosyltransferase [soil metagenome]
MKIAISTSVIQRGKSGVGQYVFALVRELLAYAGEHEFHLLVLEEDLPHFEFARDKMTIVPVAEKWRSAVKNIFWHQFILPRWLKREGIDVLHVPSYRRMVWNAPCATVATIHDLAPFHVKGKYDLARMFYGRIIVKQLVRRQNAIVSISTSTARDIERFFGVPVVNQNIVLNGLDHKRFCPGKAERPAGLDAPFFLYVSRLEHPAKNHVRLIEAFNQFKAATGSDWQLALGGSDWHGAEHIHAAAAASPFAKDIRFLGFVPDDDVPNLYRAAGAMVYPSLFEGFGMPPIEAMACACSVISSHAGSLAEVIGGCALVIDPLSVTSIEKALTQISFKKQIREALIKAGTINARRFDWSLNARAVMEVYQKAMLVPPLGGIVTKPRQSETTCVTPPAYV